MTITAESRWETQSTLFTTQNSYLAAKSQFCGATNTVKQ